MKKISSFQKGFIGAILALACWSSIEIVGSLIFREGIGPITILTIRSLIASFLFFLTVKIIKRDSLKIEKKDIFRLLIHSCLVVVHLALFWQGLRIFMNNVPVAIMLFQTIPIWVLIISFFFFYYKITVKKIFSLILGLV